MVETIALVQGASEQLGHSRCGLHYRNCPYFYEPGFYFQPYAKLFLQPLIDSSSTSLVHNIVGFPARISANDRLSVLHVPSKSSMSGRVTCKANFGTSTYSKESGFCGSEATYDEDVVAFFCLFFWCYVCSGTTSRLL